MSTNIEGTMDTIPIISFKNQLYFKVQYERSIQNSQLDFCVVANKGAGVDLNLNEYLKTKIIKSKKITYMYDIICETLIYVPKYIEEVDFKMSQDLTISSSFSMTNDLVIINLSGEPDNLRRIEGDSILLNIHNPISFHNLVYLKICKIKIGDLIKIPNLKEIYIEFLTPSTDKGQIDTYLIPPSWRSLNVFFISQLSMVLDFSESQISELTIEPDCLKNLCWYSIEQCNIVSRGYERSPKMIDVRCSYKIHDEMKVILMKIKSGIDYHLLDKFKDLNISENYQDVSLFYGTSTTESLKLPFTSFLSEIIIETPNATFDCDPFFYKMHRLKILKMNVNIIISSVTFLHMATNFEIRCRSRHCISFNNTYIPADLSHEIVLILDREYKLTFQGLKLSHYFFLRDIGDGIYQLKTEDLLITNLYEPINSTL
ncbi:hypothetical protein EON71_00385 [bacterium]|nr:MAG: hypothetical protein EON71_00385 [bacterium]